MISAVIIYTVRAVALVIINILINTGEIYTLNGGTIRTNHPHPWYCPRAGRWRQRRDEGA